MSLNELRTELGEITKKYQGNQIREQIKAIEKLSDTYPHSIKLIEECIPGENDLDSYTCFLFAIGIPPEEYPKVSGIPLVLYDGFIRRCFENRILLEKIKDVINNDIIIYFDKNNRITHAGKFKYGRVVSKWGTGHIWEHALLEVPNSYGDFAKYYMNFNGDKALRTTYLNFYKKIVEEDPWDLV